MKQKNQTQAIIDSTYAWMVFIAIATFIVYLPALRGTFTNWDDMVYVNENPYIKALSAANLSDIFSKFYMGNYHPLAMLSLAIDYQIYGLNPFGFHLTNIVLHIANSLLVMMVLHSLIGRFRVAAIAGLLFGVHALHVESVAWISERKDVLYALFYLLSVYAYTRYIPGKARNWFLLSLVFFLLSCFSKGQAVSLALTLVLIDVYAGRKLNETGVIMEKVPFFLLALIFGIVAFRAQAGADATIMANFPLHQRFAFASYGMLMYILKLLVPVGLSAYYPYPILGAAGDVPTIYWLAMLPAAGFILAMVAAWKHSKPLFFGLAFFFLNIVFLLQLIPVGRAIMADRYAYIPSIGFCFLAGWYLTDIRWVRKEYVTWVLVGFYALFLGILTFRQSEVWLNSNTLWSNAIEKNERTPVAWYNRGNTRMDSADYKGAIEDYTQCINLDGQFWRAYINRGNARSKVQDYLGSIEDYDAMIGFDSTAVNAYINRANSKRMLKDYPNALTDYNKAERLKPGMAEIYAGRASLKLDMKDYDGAIADLGKALELQPDLTAAYTSRAVVKKAKGDLSGAIADYEKAIRLDGGNSEVYNNMGNLRFQLNDLDGAMNDYAKSIRMNPKDYLGYKNRAAVQFTRRAFRDAEADFSEAIRLNPSSGELYYNRALARKETGDQGGATSDYHKAVELEPNYAAEVYMKPLGITEAMMPALVPGKLLEQGKAFESKGRLQDAIATYRKAVQEKPDYAEAWYYLGNALGKARQFGEAMNCFDKAIQYKDDYAEALSSRGIAHASMGKSDLALSDLSRAIEANPELAIAYYNRAIIYINAGKKELACPDLQKAVKLGYNQAYPVLKKECDTK
jgi:tetratricopeptide (TPR) repeat protein